MKAKIKSIAWTDDEDKIISHLVEKMGKNWSNVAKQLQKTYSYKKTGRQVRQRWYNQLDPSVSKKQWTQQEQDILFQMHQRYGNKWKNIAQLLEGRSDNSTKNRFYSTIRRSLRRINKFIMGSKDGTEKIRKIKPSTLSRYFEMVQRNTCNQGSDEAKDPQFKNVAYNLINFSRRNLNSNDHQLSPQQKQIFEKLLEQMLKFDATYDKTNQNKNIKASRKKIQKYSQDSIQNSQKFQQSEDSQQLQQQLSKHQDSQCGKIKFQQKMKQNQQNLNEDKDIPLRKQYQPIVKIQQKQRQQNLNLLNRYPYLSLNMNNTILKRQHIDPHDSYRSRNQILHRQKQPLKTSYQMAVNLLKQINKLKDQIKQNSKNNNYIRQTYATIPTSYPPAQSYQIPPSVSSQHFYQYPMAYYHNSVQINNQIRQATQNQKEKEIINKNKNQQK